MLLGNRALPMVTKCVGSQNDMRAELGREARSIVFVWQALTLADDQVRVFIYDGMVKVSVSTLSIHYGRSYWTSLITKGYRVIPEKVVTAKVATWSEN